jgi:polysaccharide export outer membrane protein
MRSEGNRKEQGAGSARRRMMFHLQVLSAVLVLLVSSRGLLAQTQTPYIPGGGSTAQALGTLAQAGGASASSVTRSTGVMPVPEDFATLKIAPGFLLNLDVYDESDLSTQLRVGPDGNIMLPLAGPVHVAGDTLAEARQQIEERFKSAKILKNPQVILDIAQYATMIIPVLGEVNSPGRLQLLAPHSLLDLISFAGGETALAGNRIEVRHQVNGQTSIATYHYGKDSNGSSISNVIIENGDTVIVPRAGIVYVLGAVFRPGGYLMQEDGALDVAQALALAMGTTLQAKTSEIRVIRRKESGEYVEFTLSYSAMTRGKITPPQLQPQDIVYVPVSKPKAILTSGTEILSAATSATIYTLR